jgi:hypothetical protein
MARMKKIIAGIILCMIVTGLDAQQTYQYRYSIFDNYMMNPAYVGAKDYCPINIGRDQRFIGLDNSSPQSYFLSINSRVGEGYIFKKDGKINEFFKKFGNTAVGLQFTQFIYGPERETNIGLTYGYHIDLKQSYKTRNPRKLILSLTPRLQHLWYNPKDMHLVEDESVYYIDEMSDKSTWIFSGDVAALYQTVKFDVGFGALSFFQTKNGWESDSLFLPTGNDTISPTLVSAKGLLYPPRFLVNGKLKFIDVYKTSNWDAYFIPSMALFYAPTRNYLDVFIDLMLENTFKKSITGIRKEIIFTGQIGLNINHRREYDPMTLFQPYVSFDFKNYAITYAHSFYIGSDIIKEGAAFGGNQISLQIKLSRDRVYKDSFNNKKF